MIELFDEPSRERFHEHYYNLFQIADEVVLTQYMVESNKSLAFQAAWEKVRRRIPDDGTNEQRRTYQKAIDDFLILVSSEFDDKVPDWWKQSIKSMEHSANKQAVFPGEPKVKAFHEPIEYLGCPKDAAVEQHGTRLVYLSGQY